MLSQRNANQSGHEDDIQQAAVSSWLSNLDPRVLRISISALSILTTKAVYNHGYHHPLRLLLLHLLATSIWEIILWLSSRKIERQFDAKYYTLYNMAHRGNLWSRAGLKLCLRFSFGTGALFLRVPSYLSFSVSVCSGYAALARLEFARSLGTAYKCLHYEEDCCMF
jgi:hypothetical protein